MENSPFENLANAVILQAVKDYRNLDTPSVIAEIEQFFRSEWFGVLSGADGEWIIQQLRKEKSHDR